MAATSGSCFSRMTLVFIVLGVSFRPAQAQYGGGAGEPNDPYLICTAEQMNAIGLNPADWDKHFKLVADIDLASLGDTQCNIIGSDPNRPFTGVFDGNQHVILNLMYRHGNRDHAGLFGYIGDPNAKVVNLGLVHIHIEAGTGRSVGSLVGCLAEGIIANCFAAGGQVAGAVAVGGLVGENRGLIANSYTTCAVVGGGCVGGLAGTNGACGRGGDTPCHSGVVSCCYSRGPVTAAEYVGGLVGFPKAGRIRSSFWNTETSGQATSAGGTGKTTAEMQDPNTFRGSGWDFFGAADGPSEVWTTDPATRYPILWWQVPEAQRPQLSHFSGGRGTLQAPYLIDTPEHLNSIGHNPRLMNAHFRLTSNIDLRGTHFFSIGSEATPFAGVFDGYGRTISNFTCVSEHGYATGVFGYVRGGNARIKRVTLVGPNVDANSGEFTGSLIGRLCQGEVIDCHVEGGTVVGGSAAGGLVGHNDSGRVVDCHSTGTVTGSYDTGGLIGSDDHGRIMNCHSSASVAGGTSAGGMIGSSRKSVATHCHATGPAVAEYGAGGLVGESYGGAFSHCYSTGAVSGGDSAGGLIGQSLGTITVCYAAGNVSGDQGIGGLAGRSDGVISDCHATGRVTGNTVVGGLVGDGSGTVSSSYSTGEVRGTEWDIGGLAGSNGGRITSSYSISNVTGDSCVGGLVGYNDWCGSILDCYASGSVTGTRGVGGFVGRNDLVIRNCYAIGRVEGPESRDVGGFVGHPDDAADDGLIEASFWDAQKSGRLASEKGTAKTTAEMHMASTFLDAGWDFVDETQERHGGHLADS